MAVMYWWRACVCGGDCSLVTVVMAVVVHLCRLKPGAGGDGISSQTVMVELAV